jgi:short-subunit dehydrogenase
MFAIVPLIFFLSLTGSDNIMSKPLALIVGVGDGVSASFARLMYKEGYQLVLSARNVSKIEQLAKETEATTVACDASQRDDVQRLFQCLPGQSQLKVVLYNPSMRVRGPFVDVDPDEVKKAIDVTAYGSFLVGQQAAAIMLKQGQGGTILFTGASAGVKG